MTMNISRHFASAVQILFLASDSQASTRVTDALHGLEAQGYSIEKVAVSQRSLASIFSYQAALILIDAPLLTFKLLELSQSEQSCPPIIVIGDEDTPQAETQALEAGAIDYIAKPELNSSLLKRSIRYALNQHAATRDLIELKRHEIAKGQLAAIIESSDDAIYSTTLDGIVSTWNRGAELVFGYSASEAIGQPVDFLVPAEYMQEKDSNFQCTERGERVPPFETIRRRKDGTLLDIGLTISPIFDSDGNVIAASAIAHDISERKRVEQSAENSARLYRILAGNFPNGSVYLLDKEERFILAEGRGLSIIGQSKETVVGKTIREVFDETHLRDLLLDTYERALTGQEVSREVEIKGRIRLIRAVPVFDGLRDGACVMAMTQDITEQKKAEVSLRASEALNRAVLNSMSARIAVIDRSGVITAVNDSWRHFRQENVGDADDPNGYRDVGVNYLVVCYSSLIESSSDTSKSAGDGIKSVLKGESRSFSLEYPCHAPNKKRWFYMMVTPLETPYGGAVISHFDITARREAEEALRRSDERFRDFLDHTPAVVFIKDEKGRYVYLNKAVEHLVRQPASELLGKTTFDRLPAEYAQRLRDNCLQVMNTGRAMEFEEVVPGADGQLHYQLVSKFPLTDTDGTKLVAGVAIDITERKQAEQALRESEMRWRSLFEGDLIGHFAGDAYGMITEANNAFLHLLGYQKSDLPLRWDELTPPEWAEEDARFANAFGAGESVPPYEKEFYRRDGSRVPVLIGASLIGDSKDQSFCFVLDLTTRKQTEEALRKSETRFRTVVDNLSEGLVICDESGNLTHWNTTALNLHGFTEANEWLRSLTDFTNIFELSTLDGEILRFDDWPLSRILRGEILHNYDLKIRRLDMEWQRIFSYGGAVVRDENGKSVLGFLTITDSTERKMAEAELRASQGLLSGIIDSALDAIITIDAQNRIIEFNPAAEHIFGFSRSEIIGRALSETIIPPSYREAHNEGMIRYFETGSGPVLNQRLELIANRSDGTQFPIELSATPISQNGTVVFAGFLRDITERKRAEAELHESKNRLAGVVESAMDAIITADESQRIVLFNPAAEKMFGYSSAEAEGQSIEILIPRRFRPNHSAHVEKFGLNGITNRKMGALGAISGLRANGEEFPIEASISQVELDEHKLYTVILRDITERHEFETNLQKANDELELRVERRTSELARINKTLKGEIAERQTVMGALGETVVQLELAKEESERANNAKSEFLSRMSHELRTPMNSILGFAQIMEMSMVDEKQTKRLAHILKAGEHLLQLINEVLNLAHVESGHLMLSIEPVRLDTTIRTIIDLIRPLCRQNDLRLVYQEEDTSIYVQADQQKFSQVLLNILSNATKYNRHGGEIHVEYEHRDGDRLRINITDTGIGIAPENIPKLFQPFERLQAAQSSIEGTGLGLALSKRLVEAMKGTMGVESTLGAGSTFWIELPKASCPLAEINRAVADITLDDGLADIHIILYIEDNLANLEVIKHVLENQPNLQLMSAMQGQIGLDLAREHHPSLILLDLNLPDIGGEEVLRRLQLDESTRSIPVVVVSADATPNQIKRLTESGAIEYLTKPLDVRNFISVIHRLLLQQDK